MDIGAASLDTAWSDAVVGILGIRKRLSHRPNSFRGGKQQRVAFPRTPVNRPTIVFADESTGNLDSRASAEILAVLRRSVDDFGKRLVMVSRDPAAASFTDRVLFLAGARFVNELLDPSADSVLERMRTFELAGRRG